MALCKDCYYYELPDTLLPCSICQNHSRFVNKDRTERGATESRSVPNPKPETDLNPRTAPDPVNHPAHYTSSGGIECIDALESMVQGYTNVQDGSEAWQVVKYVWRAPLKGRPLEDLKKARWYLERIIGRLERAGQTN